MPHRNKKVTRALEGSGLLLLTAVSRKKVAGHAVKDLIEGFFGGSAESCGGFKRNKWTRNFTRHLSAIFINAQV